MQVNEISSVSSPDFVNNFLGQLGAAPAPEIQTPETQTKTEDTIEAKAEGESSLQEKKTVEQVLKEAGEAKEKETSEAKPIISDVKKFSETLAEKNLLFKYEDGSLPETEEEFTDALSQSVRTLAQQDLKTLWENKIKGYSPQVQTVLRYADMGGTTAAELSKLVNQVHQYESIATLDPKNPDHQEQIVLIQLMNSGLSEKAAREDIADFKALNKLESKANEYSPLLKKSYEAQINQTYLEKQRAIEEEDRYVQTNATNVDYFLKNEEQYLPFKIADQNHKAAVFQLAAQPVEYKENGEAVFGWENHIKSLQMGDENSYKKYMKIMTYIANIDGYDKALSKTASNKATEGTFKKIMTTEGKANNSTSQGTDAPVISRKPSTGPWAVR